MRIFKHIFKGGSASEIIPSVRFGRYSDAYKAEEKYDAWDRSLALFEKGEYQASFLEFFEYLTDDDQQNVQTSIVDDTLRFELLQGSKLIEGVVDDKMIRAEAKVARTDALNIGFLRRMIEQNFQLKYSRYALDDNDNLTVLFDSYLLDGSPFKLYFALKEIAVNADKQDDLLIKEFDALHPINTGHLQPVSPEHKRIKIEFLRRKIREVLREIDDGRLNPEQNAGGIGYLLLDLTYRLDYLIKPEGMMMEAFERIHRTYFSQDQKTTLEKNIAIRKEYEQILERTDDDIGSELYNVSSSFGITSPSTHEQMVSFIDGELHHMDWYVENKHTSVALAIPGYIAGYGLFNYAFPPPERQLLHLYYQITEPAYFRALGFNTDLVDDEGRLDKRAIRRALRQIQEANNARYPDLRIDGRSLDTTTLTAFAKSYFLMIRDLDLKKKA
ncbi:MAG: hypothetical protein R3330_07900 [Saprospiraceae bacterium]|nr:hypothetical protein [Saprospiraceae bacterium]